MTPFPHPSNADTPKTHHHHSNPYIEVGMVMICEKGGAEPYSDEQTDWHHPHLITKYLVGVFYEVRPLGVDPSTQKGIESPGGNSGSEEARAWLTASKQRPADC